MEIEEKILVAKVMDKIEICKTRNKIMNTEFLTIYQREVIQKELNKIKIKNYFFFGGYEGAEGESLIIYPDKLEEDVVRKNLDSIIKAIKIELPKEVRGQYKHRDYLGALMRGGLNRNRIGDIIVHENGAYIIVLKENAEYIRDFLEDMVKFSKANVQVIDFSEIELKEAEFKEIKITVSSMRIDNIVSEIIKTSRNKTIGLLQTDKIFVNSKLETKPSKTINENDILVIRGKGKFLISKIIGANKKGKISIEIKKFT